MMKPVTPPYTVDRSVDALLLRNAIRLVHCLQKERGSSCAYYANNEAFEAAMIMARSSSDISAVLLRRNDVPVMSTLSKIRNLISFNRNPQQSNDEFTLHRIFVCFNTLISYVVHEYILKEISGADQKHQKITMKSRHRRGLSNDINDRLKSKTAFMPEMQNHKVASGAGARSTSNGDTRKLTTLYSTGDLDESDNGNPPTPQALASPPLSPLRSSTPEFGRKVRMAEIKPKIQQMLDLLHLFVQLKESAGIERAILSSLLALRGTDDPSLQYLMSDLILEVENQRFLVDQLESLPEDNHRDLVLDLASLSPKLQELQMIILSDFESLIHAQYDFDNIWNLITLYVDKLHSVELLLVEELECCLPVTMSKVLSSGALNSLASHSQPAPVQSSPPKMILESTQCVDEEKMIIRLSLQKVFTTTESSLTSKIESLSPEKIKQLLLDVLCEDQQYDGSASENEGVFSDDNTDHHHSAAVNLKHDMALALDTKARTSGAIRKAAKEWEISIYELKFSKRIGVGAAATTYLADWSGQEVAVKVYYSRHDESKYPGCFDISHICLVSRTGCVNF